MNRSLLLAATLALACKPLPPRGSVPVDVAAGLPRLVLLTDDAQDRVVLSATVAAGSAYDPVGREGLANLAAHAATLPASHSAAPLVPVRLQVGRDLVRFEVECAPVDLERCADRLTSVLTAPRLDEVSRVVGREASLFSLQGLPSSPAALAADVLESWIFQAHPYGHRVEGRIGTLPLLDTATVRAFYTRHVVRAATVIGVSGPVSGAQVEAFMERLRAMPTSLPPELVLMHPEPVTGRSLLMVDTGADLGAVALGAPLDVARGDDDYPALVLAFAAFGARGATPRDAVVEPVRTPGDALAGVVGSPQQQVSWQVRVGDVPTAALAATARGLLADLERLVVDGLTQSELDATRATLKARLVALHADPIAALDAATDAVAAGTPDPLRLLPDALDKLTLDQVNVALRGHVDPSRLRLVVVGGQGQAVADALAAPVATTPGAPPARAVDQASVRTMDGLFR